MFKNFLAVSMNLAGYLFVRNLKKINTSTMKFDNYILIYSKINYICKLSRRNIIKKANTNMDGKYL